MPLFVVLKLFWAEELHFPAPGNLSWRRKDPCQAELTGRHDWMGVNLVIDDYHALLIPGTTETRYVVRQSPIRL